MTEPAIIDAPTTVPAGTTILDACSDPELFGQWFRRPQTWRAWLAFLAVLFGLPVMPDQAALVEQCTGRNELPFKAFGEAWLICGRRAGKSFVLALVAVYLATFRSYAQYLAPGERATISIIATDKRQARVIYRYVRGLISGTPLLSPLLQGEPTMAGLDLANGVTIEISTASFRTSRGYTFAAVLADEAAFWATDDAAEPDFAVLDAVRPGLSTIPGAMLLVASSPYAKRGALWSAFKDFYGRNDPDVLVWKAATRVMNPTVSQGVIDRAIERDPASAAAEFGAEFRNDLEAFLDRELIEACVDRGVLVRPPIPNVRYVAFVDPSGGRGDAFTLAIGHKDDDRAVLDCLVERKPPFDPIAVSRDMSEVIKSYRLRECTGDRYSAEFVVSAFAAAGVRYIHSQLDRSAIYGEALGIFTSGRARLVDNARLVSQLAALERKTTATRDRIDHAPGQHDDLANASCGALALAAAKPRVVTSGTSIIICGSGNARNIPGSDVFVGEARQRVWDRMLRDAAPT